MKKITEEDKKRYLYKILETDPCPGNTKRIRVVDEIVHEVTPYGGHIGTVAFPHSVWEACKRLWRAKGADEVSKRLNDLLKEIENPSEHNAPDGYISAIVIGG